MWDDEFRVQFYPPPVTFEKSPFRVLHVTRRFDSHMIFFVNQLSANFCYEFLYELFARVLAEIIKCELYTFFTCVALKKGHRVRKARGKTRGNSILPYYYIAILDKHCSNLASPLSVGALWFFQKSSHSLFVGAQCFLWFFLIFRVDLQGAEIIFLIFWNIIQQV